MSDLRNLRFIKEFLKNNEMPCCFIYTWELSFKLASDHFHIRWKWEGAKAKIQEYRVPQIQKRRLKNIALDIELIENIERCVQSLIWNSHYDGTMIF